MGCCTSSQLKNVEENRKAKVTSDGRVDAKELSENMSTDKDGSRDESKENIWKTEKDLITTGNKLWVEEQTHVENDSRLTNIYSSSSEFLADNGSIFELEEEGEFDEVGYERRAKSSISQAREYFGKLRSELSKEILEIEVIFQNLEELLDLLHTLADMGSFFKFKSFVRISEHLHELGKLESDDSLDGKASGKISNDVEKLWLAFYREICKKEAQVIENGKLEKRGRIKITSSSSRSEANFVSTFKGFFDNLDNGTGQFETSQIYNLCSNLCFCFDSLGIGIAKEFSGERKNMKWWLNKLLKEKDLGDSLSQKPIIDGEVLNRFRLDMDTIYNNVLSFFK